MRNALRIIDSLSEWVGRFLGYFVYALVLLICFDVVARYVFSATTSWGFEVAIMLGAAFYSLAWAPTHRENGHVRVDVIYVKAPPRVKAFIDTFGAVFLLLPLLALLIKINFSYTWRAWAIAEKSTMGYWYPPLAPIRTVVLVGFSLLFLQAIAQFIRDFRSLTRGETCDKG